MGYYIDFVFSNEETQESVLKKMMEAGAILDPYEPETRIGWQLLYSAGGVILQPGEVGYHIITAGKPHIFLDTYRKESPHAKGNWAYTRLSWATDPDRFVR